MKAKLLLMILQKIYQTDCKLQICVKLKLKMVRAMESLGFKVTYLNVDNDGFVDLEQLGQSITSETTLVSIMYANNETGAIQPIQEIKSLGKFKVKISLHSEVDAEITINVKSADNIQ